MVGCGETGANLMKCASRSPIMEMQKDRVPEMGRHGTTSIKDRKHMKFNEKKVLIAYYSRKGNNYVSGRILDLPVGNTQVIAAMIKELTNGTLLQLEAAHPYPSGYDECTEVAKEEFRTKARPALAKKSPDLSRFEVIFLGYPNWWGTMPMPVFTFLEGADLSGKTIIPFCTHEGSGMGNSERDIIKTCPQSQVHKGLAITGSKVASSRELIEKWVASIQV